jgi:ornithine cyclodeaminase
MLIQDEKSIHKIGIDWNKSVDLIEDAVRCLSTGDFSQPVKPYLRYRDPVNRIIAMPAFVGGDINMAGIKWISSFPGNIDKGIARAHSVVILNDADTGQPLGTINTPLLSIIRTAAVSGLVFKYFNKARNPRNLKVGMTGFGPIGQYHLNMCLQLFGDMIDNFRIYDIRPIDPSLITDKRVEVVDSWEEAYLDADVFMTCTVSDAAYINKKPKPGSLHMNVSLRDYTVDVYEWFKEAMFVDDWEEVNREKTDIEMMHLEKGLQEKDTSSIVDMVVEEKFSKYSNEVPIMFNPMGMAVFDIAIGSHYYREELTNSVEVLQ